MHYQYIEDWVDKYDIQSSAASRNLLRDSYEPGSRVKSSVGNTTIILIPLYPFYTQLTKMAQREPIILDKPEDWPLWIEDIQEEDDQVEAGKELEPTQHSRTHQTARRKRRMAARLVATPVMSCHAVTTPSQNPERGACQRNRDHPTEAAEEV